MSFRNYKKYLESNLPWWELSDVMLTKEYYRELVNFVKKQHKTVLEYLESTYQEFVNS